MSDELKSVLFCLNKRAQAIGQTDQWYWVPHDPQVSCFLPVLFILEQEGYLQLCPQVRQASHNIYLRNNAFWIKREQKIRPILEAFSKANIDIIPLKGASLLGTLYQNAGTRLMGDIDILVRPEHYIQAAQMILDFNLYPKWSHTLRNPFHFKCLPEAYWPGELP